MFECISVLDELIYKNVFPTLRSPNTTINCTLSKLEKPRLMDFCEQSDSLPYFWLQESYVIDVLLHHSIIWGILGDLLFCL